MSGQNSNERLTAGQLRALLKYFPDTGEWTWLVAVARRVKVGDTAGWRRADGRRKISIDSKTYYGSRLAWLYMTGQWPDGEVDHDDLNKANDRWSNLRKATHAQNQTNSRPRRHNKAGLKGVAINSKGHRLPFYAQISVNGKVRRIGSFATAQAAHEAYCAEARSIHPEFFRGE